MNFKVGDVVWFKYGFQTVTGIIVSVAKRKYFMEFRQIDPAATRHEWIRKRKVFGKVTWTED